MKLIELQDKIEGRMRNARNNIQYFDNLLQADIKFSNLFENLGIIPSGKEVFFTSNLAEVQNDMSGAGLRWGYDDLVFQTVFPFEEFQIFSGIDESFRNFAFPENEKDLEKLLRSLSRWLK